MTLRLLFAAVWLASSALAGPPLTTIQDVLYKADGTRFNGTVTISWTSFQAMDNSTIATQSITVKIVDGNLRVQLVPTTTSTPATYYSVTYNSNGRIQFQETWSVPSSAQPLHVRDVRDRRRRPMSRRDTGGGHVHPGPGIRHRGAHRRPGRAAAQGAGLRRRPRGRGQFAGRARIGERQRHRLRARGWLFGALRRFAAILRGRRFAGRHRGRVQYLVHPLGRPRPRLQPGGLPQRHAPEARPGLHLYRQHDSICRRRPRRSRAIPCWPVTA